jgi:hypothetical protein
VGKKFEKIRQAGGKIVEGFGRNGHRRGHEGKRGGHTEKKAQGPAKWVHSDAAGITQHQWRESVAKVENKLNSISTPSTITASATTNRQRPEIKRTGTYAEKEREREIAASETASASSSTAASTSASRATNSAGTSPLTMLDFGSDIEQEPETEIRGRNEKYVMVGSEDEQEENDYEVLDEEVLSVLLGLNENMSHS